jgi:hypothetical protein
MAGRRVAASAPLTADRHFADPHLVQGFTKKQRVLAKLDGAGVERNAVLALGLQCAPRALDVRAIERARAKTHTGRGREPRRGGNCTCLSCRTFERPSLAPEHSPCRTACACDACEMVARDLVATAFGRYGRTPPDTLQRVQRAAAASRRAAKAIGDLPDFMFWVRDAGPAPTGARSLTLDEPRGRRRVVLTDPSDPEAITWWPFEAAEARAHAAWLQQLATALDAFSGSLRQPKGRPVERAENAWILGFALLVREANAIRRKGPPGSWLDDVGCALFKLFFGWEMSLSEYKRTRQRLMRHASRPRRSQQ